MSRRSKEDRQAGQAQGRCHLYLSKLILTEGLRATWIYKIYPFHIALYGSTSLTFNFEKVINTVSLIIKFSTAFIPLIM